ncbi:ParA family protein [Nocardia cyriacigeorgica]|uniref:ParA family protein n=1 Tax=Nocardia cyriacigeorgica TaxID=135487 RepID=UPI0018944E0B|nr:ParA family protein [Nocardia cyriacigeorgica]MBF6163059.1 ParA family protein [Nocardia cyriacigeorgica]MBF6202027.1 ParA family protein [Nocardia cyriacigeorgica]MBF6518537.1 ParA family protein [Nocardia cyriacigeorgica]
MGDPEVLAVYSETGGATKTTTAVSLAVAAALRGWRTVLIDLDPRGATTKWTDVQPKEPGLDVSAILADPDPDGWAEELAVPCPWQGVSLLRVIPSARALSNREKTSEDHGDIRLRLSLNGIQADKVVLDLPNRQGGVLIQNALEASDKVVYAAKLDEDGLDGVEGARTSVLRFKKHRAALGAADRLAEAGIVVGLWTDTVPTRDQRRCEDELMAAYGDLVLDPKVPDRVIVKEARSAGTYYGFYEKGRIVHAAYDALAGKVFA